MMSTNPPRNAAVMIRLYRTLKGRERRYCIELLPTLFGGWIVTRSYGSASKTSPMRVIKNGYADEEEARTQMEHLLRLKMKKGYRPLIHGK